MHINDATIQILLSISQKVRSTSHFWSKLYEVSTPSHLLYPGSAPTSGNTASSAGGGGNPSQGSAGARERGDSFESSPTGSPFSSRAGTPIGSPVPGSVLAGSAESAGPSHSLRKMISRHSSRSLVVSKSQMERGRLLELCLSVLGCSAQWHLQLLANRYVFCWLYTSCAESFFSAHFYDLLRFSTFPFLVAGRDSQSAQCCDAPTFYFAMTRLP
jgi:hypothetical protein